MAVYRIYPTKDQEKLLNAFLEASEISFVKDIEEELPPHVLTGIVRGQADVEAGRVITLEEFKRKMRLL